MLILHSWSTVIAVMALRTSQLGIYRIVNFAIQPETEPDSVTFT